MTSKSSEFCNVYIGSQQGIGVVECIPHIKSQTTCLIVHSCEPRLTCQASSNRCVPADLPVGYKAYKLACHMHGALLTRVPPHITSRPQITPASCHKSAHSDTSMCPLAAIKFEEAGSCKWGIWNRIGGAPYLVKKPIIAKPHDLHIRQLRAITPLLFQPVREPAEHSNDLVSDNMHKDALY